MFPKLRKEENPLGHVVTENEINWIGACFILGGIPGCFIWCYLADVIGRKYTMILMNILVGIANVILAYGQIIELYYLARLFAGISLGGMLIIVPVYCTEISETKMRGILSTSKSLAMTLATTFTFGIGPYLDIPIFTMICFVFPLIFFVFGFFLTETPYYLIKKERYDEAEIALLKCRGEINVHVIQDELNVIKHVVNMYDDVSFKEVFQTKGTIKGLVISTALLTFQQCTGSTIIMFYIQTIFDETGSNIPSDISSTIVGVVAFIFALVALLLVDKFGRKVLLIVSSIGMFIAELLLGVYFYLLETTNEVKHIHWLPLLSLLLFVSFYDIGYASIPLTVTVEVLPQRIKNKLAAFISAYSWIIAFAIIRVYSLMLDSLHLYGELWLFSCFNGLAVLFTWFFLPETKGKTFKEIQDILNK